MRQINRDDFEAETGGPLAVHHREWPCDGPKAVLDGIGVLRRRRRGEAPVP